MTALTHPFVSQVADDADPNTVSPSNWNADHALTIPAGTTYHEVAATTVASTDSVTVAGDLRVDDPPLGFIGSFRVGTQTIRTDQYLLAWQSLTVNDGASLTVEPGGSITIFDLPSAGGSFTVSGRAA